MRTITDHVVDGDSANHQLTITVTDEPGAGGANHEYEIGWRGPDFNGQAGTGEIFGCRIGFQNGPIKEVGVNGVTQEALIAICMDRLKSFQAGPYACEDNEVALGHLVMALAFMQKRTRARIARGVEGTHAK